MGDYQVNIENINIPEFRAESRANLLDDMSTDISASGNTGIHTGQIHGISGSGFMLNSCHNLSAEVAPEDEAQVSFRKKDTQLSNLKAVYEAVKDFSREAGIGFSYPFLDNETIVLESGHQPNFLPHSGFWKKLFLLDFLRKKLHRQGKKTIAIFGFADYNLCTAKLLTQNKLPAVNKLGFETIGFKISGEGRWKRFDHLEKPDERDWKKEMEKIRAHYKKYSISQDMHLNLTELMETLEDCYSSAKNFPDLNAFFISRICNNLLNLDISFFRYSDLQKRKVFLDEWRRVINNLEVYNGIYNNSIKHFKLDIPLCPPGSLPFWYHCPCGAKVNLSLKGDNALGKCKICSGEHAVGMYELEKNFVDMSPNAVARNIIFSEGMGTDVFMSGSGGGLRYGKISDEISKNLGFCLPVTISWKSRDYCIGPAHAAALRELGRICGIPGENIGKEDIDKTIKDKKTKLIEMIAEANKNGDRSSIKKYEGQYVSLSASIAIINAIYKTTPSVIDIFVSQGIRKVIQYWEHALKGIDGEQMIAKDIAYDNENTISIYKKLEGIGD